MGGEVRLGEVGKEERLLASGETRLPPPGQQWEGQGDARPPNSGLHKN
jgi:hypothetical protein